MGPPGSFFPSRLLLLHLSDPDRVIALLFSSYCLVRPLLLSAQTCSDKQSADLSNFSAAAAAAVVWNFNNLVRLTLAPLILSFVIRSHSLCAGSPAFSLLKAACADSRCYKPRLRSRRCVFPREGFCNHHKPGHSNSAYFNVWLGFSA